MLMQKFQDEGIHTYEQASKKLKSLNVSLSFQDSKLSRDDIRYAF